MAALVRLHKIPKLISRINLAPTARLKCAPKTLNFCRTVGTSGTQKSDKVSENANKECEPQKNWVSYGFCEEDKYIDRHLMHLTLFVVISFCFTFGGFYIAYIPDYQLKDWSLREAYLELKRRESLGLPLIDPNLVDPSKFVLPTDEELGDMDIII